MKIKFKISKHQLDVWHNCVEMFWIDCNCDSPVIIRLVYHALSALLHKLKIERTISKSQYGFSIDKVVALAFVAHIQQYSKYIVDPADAAVINQIIGIIDQKTK